MNPPTCLQTNEPIYQIRTKTPGPQGELPYTEELLRNSPSGGFCALPQNSGMGWQPQ